MDTFISFSCYLIIYYSMWSKVNFCPKLSHSATLEANAKLFNWFYLSVVIEAEWQQTETVRTHALYPRKKEFHFGTPINLRTETSINVMISFLFRDIFNLLISELYFPLKKHLELVEWSVESASIVVFVAHKTVNLSLWTFCKCENSVKCFYGCDSLSLKDQWVTLLAQSGLVY